MEKKEKEIKTYGDLAEAAINNIICIKDWLEIGEYELAFKEVKRFKINFFEKYGHKNIYKAINIANRLRVYSNGLMRATNMDIANKFDKKKIFEIMLSMPVLKAELDKEIE